MKISIVDNNNDFWNTLPKVNYEINKNINNNDLVIFTQEQNFMVLN